MCFSFLLQHLMWVQEMWGYDSSYSLEAWRGSRALSRG